MLHLRRLGVLSFLNLLVIAHVLCAAAPAHDTDGARQVVRSTGSGAWSAPETWEKQQLPAEGDRVVIRAGHRVLYDVESTAVIRVVQIAGTLSFASDRDTRLEAGLIRVEPNEEVSEEGFECDKHMAGDAMQAEACLEIGTTEAPIDARHRALVRLVPCEGMNPQSCPALVCCGGRVTMHGAPLAHAWTKLAATASLESSEIKLADSPEGWRPGDRVLVTSTARLFLFDDDGKLIPSVEANSESEARTIAAVVDRSLVLDRPLTYTHSADGDYRGEVANLSRNVIVESAAPEGVRGHTMFHAGSMAQIAYAEFRHLGKRGVLGRYSLHFHECRDSMRGSYVIGASIHHSHNRWLTIHGTDYLLVRDCVGYKSVGHGYFLEDGTEVFNVLDRNLAVQACHGEPLPEQMLPFDRNEGAGFWWGNSLNTFTRNVAAECDQYGFRFEMTKTDKFDPVLTVPQADGTLHSTDARTLPFVRFEDNEVHTLRRFALNLGGIRHVSTEADHRAVNQAGADLSQIQGGDVLGVGPDTHHPFVIRNFRVWNSHWVFHGGSPCVQIENLDGYQCTYGIFKTRIDAHEYRHVRLRKIDTPEIFQSWGNSTVTENYFRYLDPTDDLPPTTVITSARGLDDKRVVVRGTTADNGPVKHVLVNDREARSLRANFAEWEVELPATGEPIEITAAAEDAAGNHEPRPHRVMFKPQGN